MRDKYTKKNITKDWLLQNRFRYNPLCNEPDEDIETYTYRFPVHKYGIVDILECELLVHLGEDEIEVNVYDYRTNNKYAAFYCTEYGNYEPILRNIHAEIDKKIKKLGIKKETIND